MILLLVGTAASNAETMIENVPVNGTLAKEEKIQIEMTGIKDLRYYILGVKLDSYFYRIFANDLDLLLKSVRRLERRRSIVKPLRPCIFRFFILT